MIVSRVTKPNDRLKMKDGRKRCFYSPTVVDAPYMRVSLQESTVDAAVLALAPLHGSVQSTGTFDDK